MIVSNDSIEALKGCSKILENSYRYDDIVKQVLAFQSQIVTKVTAVPKTSHRFTQGKMVFSNDEFILSKKTGMIEDETKNAEWEEVGTFASISKAIDRSTQGDFFNMPYDKANKLWPKFPNEC